VTVNTFSSLNRQGLPELEKVLNKWLALDVEKPDAE
jgi:GTP-binding protein